MKLIPAIDIINGQCVRLTRGDYRKKKIYHENPIDVARNLEKQGFQYLHLVDLDGARSSSSKNLYVLNQIALATNLIIDFGGGIKSEDSLVQALRSGATQVNVGSIAVRNPNLVKFWLLRYGPEKIIISADARERKIAINGWQEETSIDLFEFINDFNDAGAVNFVCTDISKDGMMMGSSVDLYSDLLNNFPDINLIASGGVASIDEVKDLESIGIAGVILGKALYEGILDGKLLINTFQ